MPTDNSTDARPGRVLAFWMILSLVLNGSLWLTGFKTVPLASAVDLGAARAESWGVGEMADEAIRKAIRTQHDTLPFWTTLALIADLAAGPLLLAGRAVAVATSFAALAALTGRPVWFQRGFAECAAAQGYWVLGLAVRAALMFALRRTEVETSLTLLLPAGTHPATVWVAMRQLDVFALIGWASLARGGWRRGQVNLLSAALICFMLAAIEAGVCITTTLLVEAGMRLTLIPDWVA